MNALLLSLALATQQCGPGGCAPATQPVYVPPPPAVLQAPVPAGYEWRQSDDNHCQLFLGGRQVGSWRYSDQTYHARLYPDGPGGEKRFAAPVPTPPYRLHPSWLKPAPADRVAGDFPVIGSVPNYGVDTSRISRTPKYSVNGRECSPTQCYEAAGGNLPNDATNLSVSFVAPTRERAEAMQKECLANPEFAALAPSLHLQPYAAADAMLKCGFQFDAPEEVLVQSPDGKVLHRYAYEGAAATVGAVRKAKDGYDPRKDPNLNGGLLDGLKLPKLPDLNKLLSNPVVLLLGGLLAVLLLNRPQPPKVS